MGPALRQLFQDRKDAPYPVAADANGRLKKLFNTHGEALIAALEFALSCTMTYSPADAERLDEIENLLAQLEAEAQP